MKTRLNIPASNVVMNVMISTCSNKVVPDKSMLLAYPVDTGTLDKVNLLPVCTIEVAHTFT